MTIRNRVLTREIIFYPFLPNKNFSCKMSCSPFDTPDLFRLIFENIPLCNIRECRLVYKHWNKSISLLNVAERVLDETKTHFKFYTRNNNSPFFDPVTVDRIMVDGSYIVVHPTLEMKQVEFYFSIVINYKDATSLDRKIFQV